MKSVLRISPLALIPLLLFVCNPLQSLTKSVTPTAVIMADTFFGGCAYLDSNNNGEIDPDDQRLEDAMFFVTLNGGYGFRAVTFKNGCATVTIPGGLGKESWPVTARMEPPEGSGYELLSPGEVVLEYPKEHADFLFVDPQSTR
jgi:hypothetical protein